MNGPKVGETYRHFKGHVYKIIALASHSETGESMVVYQAIKDEQETYVRPLTMFLEKVDKNKYPNISQEYRFEKISSKDLEEDALDTGVMEFLDADTYEEKLNILAFMHHRITNDMINTMTLAIDVEVQEGNLEERYEALKNCLLTLEKFECSRMH